MQVDSPSRKGYRMSRSSGVSVSCPPHGLPSRPALPTAARQNP